MSSDETGDALASLTPPEAAGLLAALVDELIPGDDNWPAASAVGVQGLVAARLFDSAGEAEIGRIVAAAGRAGVRFDPSKVRVRIGDVTVFARGLPVRDDAVEREAAAVMKRAEYTVRVDLGAGTAAAHYTTCDIGHEYVRINADYRS